MAATVRSFSPHYRSRPKCRRPLRPAGQPGGHSRPGFGFSARRLPPLSCRSMAFALTSPAFTDGSAVPAKYTCDGADVSPPLVWSGAPAGTVSFALLVDDPDAPAGTWVHWVLYNLPATAGGRAWRDERPLGREQPPLGRARGPEHAHAAARHGQADAARVSRLSRRGGGAGHAVRTPAAAGARPETAAVRGGRDVRQRRRARRHVPHAPVSRR